MNFNISRIGRNRDSKYSYSNIVSDSSTRAPVFYVS